MGGTTTGVPACYDEHKLGTEGEFILLNVYLVRERNDEVIFQFISTRDMR